MAALVPAMMQFDCNSSGCLRELAVERQAQLVAGNPDLLSVLYLARENHFCKRVLHRFLDHALQGPRPVRRIPPFLGKPVSRNRIERNDDLAIIKKLLQPRDLDVDDTSHLRLLEAMEQDDFINPVEELRPERRSNDGPNLLIHSVGVLPLRLVD